MMNRPDARLLTAGLTLALICCALLPAAGGGEPSVSKFVLPRTSAKPTFAVTAF